MKKYGPVYFNYLIGFKIERSTSHNTQLHLNSSEKKNKLYGPCGQNNIKKLSGRVILVVRALVENGLRCALPINFEPLNLILGRGWDENEGNSLTFFVLLFF